MPLSSDWRRLSRLGPCLLYRTCAFLSSGGARRCPADVAKWGGSRLRGALSACPPPCPLNGAQLLLVADLMQSGCLPLTAALRLGPLSFCRIRALPFPKVVRRCFAYLPRPHGLRLRGGPSSFPLFGPQGGPGWLLMACICESPFFGRPLFSRPLLRRLNSSARGEQHRRSLAGRSDPLEGDVPIIDSIPRYV